MKTRITGNGVPLGVARAGRLARLSTYVLTMVALGAAMSTVHAADLTIGTKSEPVMDPHFMWTDANVSYYMQIYGGLTRTNESSQVQPNIAQSWKALSPTQWSFTLRPGVKFDDGTLVTTQDVIDSFHRVETLKASAPFTGAISGVESVTAPDAHTILISTKTPNPILPQRVSLIQIIPSKIANTASSDDFTSGRADIGTGPYKVSQFKSGDRLVLVRNPNYWGTPGKWDKLTFRFIPDGGARVAALLAKDVDMIDAVPPPLADRLKSDSDVHLVTGPSGRIIFLALDQQRDVTPFVTDTSGKPLMKNPYKDHRVREALSLAIDRQAIVSRVLRGLAFPTGQITPKGYGGYDDTIAVPVENVAKAKKLLADAGYPNGFGLTLTCPNDRYVEDARVCQALGQMFSRIGLKVNVQAIPNAVLTPKAMDANGDRISLAMMGWADSAGEALVLSNVIHTPDAGKKFGSWNWGHYSNPDVDHLIETASGELDATKRHALLAQAMKTAMDDDAVIPLYAQSVVVGLRKGLGYKIWTTENTIGDSVSVQP